jgi:hypothetical protein
VEEESEQAENEEVVDPTSGSDELPELGGPATTAARLEDLFQSSGDEQPTEFEPTGENEKEFFDAELSPEKVSRFRKLEKELKPERITGRERGGFRVRRVRRLLRHIEPWSVLKIGLIFYLCVWGMTVIATSMVWGAASDAGTIEKVEHFIAQLFALEDFAFDTEQIFRIFVLGGLVMVVGGTATTVVLVVVFNLISDLMGGIRFTVIEEETAVRRRKVRSGDRVLPKLGNKRQPPPTG